MLAKRFQKFGAPQSAKPGRRILYKNYNTSTSPTIHKTRPTPKDICDHIYCRIKIFLQKNLYTDNNCKYLSNVV